MSAHGKRYREARAAIDREKLYAPAEAFATLKAVPDAKFDETVEVHFRLGLNVRHADEQLRGTIMLPHGTGRSTRVAVFAEGDKAREAQEAGADVVGTADLAAQIEEGFDDFDVAIATPDQMSVVGKLGRILGPRGKMPNPKTGTVTMDVGKAVREAKAGKLEYRTDRGANVHVTIGKKSFDERQLAENYAAPRAMPAPPRAQTVGPSVVIGESRDRAGQWRPESQRKIEASLLSRGGAKVKVRIFVTDTSKATLDRLKSLGVEVTSIPQAGRLVLATVETAKLQEVAKLAQVRYIAAEP